MDIFEKLTESGKVEGGHVFISHSRSDVEKARELRNILEKAGFYALCFYLKCMQDCMANPYLKAELESLLEREVNAREWFVFADSDRAQKSYWVNHERTCAQRDNTKKIMHWKLDGKDSADIIADRILHNLRVFISCSYQDVAVARRVRDKLVEKDYRVFWDEDILAGRAMGDAIAEASRYGCVLALLSQSAVDSPYVAGEIARVIENGGNVCVVLLGDVKLTGQLYFLLATQQHYRLPEVPGDEDIEKIIEAIGVAILQSRKIKAFQR